jgi:predicted HD phosphohydrolase
VAIEPDYASTLSAVSVATLSLQGGPATPDEVEAFLSSPWANEALALRKADDQAKSVGGEEISETDVVGLIISVTSGRQHS